MTNILVESVKSITLERQRAASSQNHEPIQWKNN